LLLTCDTVPYSIFQSSIMPLFLHIDLFFMCWKKLYYMTILGIFSHFAIVVSK
jgi:hypothetical protein